MSDRGRASPPDLAGWAASVAPLELVERKLRIIDKAEAMVGLLDGSNQEWLDRCHRAVEEARARLDLDGETESGSKHPPPLGDAAEMPQAARLKLVPMQDVAASHVEWLWGGRLPRGKLAVLAGDPGLGKSYLTLKIAAIVSQGGEWPDGSRATAGHVLIISAEDDYGDTIRPRLDCLGADVARITAIDGVLGDGPDVLRPFSLRMDIDLLRQGIADTGAVLVVVDPLNAFLGGIDAHKAAEVRGVLSPLAHVAGETRAAILAVHHLNKGSSQNALYRASGSLDFVAAARIVHGVAPDPDIEGRRLFVPVKCNIAAMPEGIGFRIDDAGINFDNLPVTLDASAAFASLTIDREERSEREMAKDFIVEQLADGPLLVKELFKVAKEYGYSEKTIRRAGSDLGVEKTKSGYQGAWRWSLPDDLQAPKMPKESKGAHVSDVGTFDIFEPETVEPVATFGEPRQPDKAISLVAGSTLERAARIAIDVGAASRVLFEKRLGLYEAEACQVLDHLAALGIIAAGNGRARSVLVNGEDLDRLLESHRAERGEP